MDLNAHIPDETDDSGRLQRPWAVVVFAFLISVAVVVVLAAMNGGIDRLIENKSWIGLACFVGFALMMSIVYAMVGSKVSKRLAGRIVGTICGVIALAGLGFLVYIMRAYAP
jgi:hypothetical protein